MPVAALFYGAMAALACAGAALTSAGPRLVWQAPVAAPAAWWQAGLGVAVALLALTWLAELTLPAMRRLGAELAATVAPFDGPRVLALALLSGVAEEALFRGPLQHALGLWPTVAVFGLLHGGHTWRLWPWTVFALAAGLAFGWLALRYQSVWPSALAHVVVNAVNLRRLARYLEVPA